MMMMMTIWTIMTPDDNRSSSASALSWAYEQDQSRHTEPLLLLPAYELMTSLGAAGDHFFEGLRWIHSTDWHD